MLNIKKHCVDYVRMKCVELTGTTVGAGHAHELVAANFGYATAAALGCDLKYPLANLPQAEIIVPDLALMERRRTELVGLADNAPETDTIASCISECLDDHGCFAREVRDDDDLQMVMLDFLAKNHLLIENALMGEIGLTNAFFGDPDYVDFDFKLGDDALVATVEGLLQGKNDPKRVFHGDRIVFSIVLTWARIAGRTAFAKPSLEITGTVDDSRYWTRADPDDEKE